MKASRTATHLPKEAKLPWGPLCCPRCLPAVHPLELAGAWLNADCGHRYPVRDGIPMLLTEEPERWAGNALFPDPEQRHPPELDLSVIIPALREGENLALLLPQLIAVLDAMPVAYEVLVIVGPDDDSLGLLPPEVAAVVAIREQSVRGYGGAVRSGIALARGRYVVTMDADLSHRPDFLRAMWAHRNNAEIVIASRYVKGGGATMPPYRWVLSRILNIVFRRGLSLAVRDISSGYRLMRTDAVRRLPLQGQDFDLVQELLVRAHVQGWRIAEVPFHYAPRHTGRSHAALLRFGLAYLRTFWRLWRLRNTISAADYDYHAYDSSIPLQRYWQRSRFRWIGQLIRGRGAVLDVGCGSSRIIGALPRGSVALDILLPKLRYARRFNVPSVNASGLALPYPDAAFPCVLSSQVIERLPKDARLIDELCRVVRPGGRLILGTTDYSSRVWTTLGPIYGRIVPGGSAATHYTRAELIALLAERGFSLDEERDILGAEIILAFHKDAA